MSSFVMFGVTYSAKERGVCNVFVGNKLLMNVFQETSYFGSKLLMKRTLFLLFLSETNLVFVVFVGNLVFREQTLDEVYSVATLRQV